MERRLTRARNKVTDARIPFRVPPDELLVERLAGVLRVVYLVFNEGHAATRGDLRAEAIRLARLLVRLMPDEAEAHGLLALLLLTDARSAARVSGDGLVSLAEQDRRAVGRGRDRRGRRGARARAAAAAAGAVRDPGRDRRAARRRRTTSTPPTGRRSRGSTRELARHDPSPVVAVNRAVAVGLRGRAGGGARTAARRSAARPLRPLHAARFELLRRAGDVDAGAAALADRDRALRQRASSARRYAASGRGGGVAPRRAVGRSRPARRPARARRRRASRASKPSRERDA